MPIVTYTRTDTVATIRMDDGKANAVSPRMLVELNAAFDRAEADAAAVILTGRPGVFSGGFDLATFAAGGDTAADLNRGGFELAARMLAYPHPLVIACSGHAIAMGCFLLLAADYRIGVQGAFRVQANEVALGITVPRAAIELCRARLAPACVDRALLLSETFTPETAVAAGFLDRLVAPDDLDAAATKAAAAFAALNRPAHTATKSRARAATLDALRAAIAADDPDTRAVFAAVARARSSP